MRFIDEAKIHIAAGRGGPGSVSFRREKFIPRGGPDGGDGGRGGDVIFRASIQMGTLQDFRYKRTYQAGNGNHGSGANKAGKDGQDIEIRVPVGTVIRDTDSGEILFDFTDDGQTWLACQGGRGGKGNAHFVSSTFQAPRFAQPGELGEFKDITLELKLIADAAIVGFPNAGKSTLISAISAAKPKIADYPFTTLTPNLGVVSLPTQGDRSKDGQSGGERDAAESFVIADIPGLIEGAHRGAGLGHKFLKHIERTRVFVHLMDGTKFLEDATKPDFEDSFTPAVENLVERYQAIRKELGLFNEKLLHKPEIVVLNKVDVIESNPDLVDRARQALRQRIADIRGTHPEPSEPMVISAATRRGVDELVFAVYGKIRQARQEAARTRKDETSETPLPDDEDLRA